MRPTIHHLRVEFVTFRSRAERSEYTARRYQAILRGKVLDVGCDEALLRKLLPESEYVGIDIGGAPDIRLDLESVERLPFQKNTFDCVVCTDVLEHLDSLHLVFNEILRVSRRHVILSLPNCWAAARVPIERGHGSPGHYGLPLDKPNDRHKWFFSLADAVAFVEGHAQKLHFVIRDVCAMEKPRPLIVRILRRLRYPKQIYYLNRYAHAVWFHLEKQPAASAAK
jgi:SAM-dependent methyltransferase